MNEHVAQTNDNRLVVGGHKSDFDGHNKRSYNNIHVFESYVSFTVVS